MPGPGRPFEKGRSGNPTGRPKTKLLTEALVKQLAKRAAKGGRTDAEEIARQMIAEARHGNVAAAKLIWDRCEGLPTQPIEHSGPDGARLRFTIRIAGDDGDGDGIPPD